MAIRNKSPQKRAAGAAETARPYVQRLVDDQDLRDDLLDAYESARNAYGRATNGKTSAKSVLDDNKMQKELKSAAESLKSASDVLREPEKKRKGGLGFRHLLLLAIVGAILALVLSEDLRKQVLDQLFGAEEEFEYSSTTAPPSPPPSAGS